MSTEPWPSDDALLARQNDARSRRLFQEETPLDFSLTADFGAINKERTPNNTTRFAGIVTVGGRDLAVRLGSRGHLRLKQQTCDFVPLRVEFARDQLAGTMFEGQRTLKLGTHCGNDPEFDQYVLREYLAYRLTNLATPLSFRVRLARATYIDARSKKRIGTHPALFLEDERDVAWRLLGREVRLPHMLFADFDRQAVTTMNLLEYMLGNTDYSIWGLHNVVIVQDKTRRFLPVPYDFDVSGMVHAPYGVPDARLFLSSVTDRRYRGPCRTLEEFSAALEPFRARRLDMMTAIDSMAELHSRHRNEMREYLESFFRRVATPESIKKTFVDGCPATRKGV